MQQDLRDIFLAVLNLIEFTDNKDIYADEFIQNCEKQALLDLLTALPQDKQEAFKRQIARVTDQEQQKAIILEYITPEQYQQALQKASATAFQGLIEEIIPTLSNEQAANLQTYFNSLTMPPASK